MYLDDNVSPLDTFGIKKAIKIQKASIQVYWGRPRHNQVKLNTDGNASNLFGLIKGGGIFRDSDGTFIGGFMKSFGFGFAFDAELAAVFLFFFFLGIEIVHALERALD